MPANCAGAAVGGHAHQQAAGRRAPRDQPGPRRPAAFHQVRGAGGEVGERIRLVQLLALLVPAPAHLAAAADVRDREHEPAVQQRQPGRAEVRIDRALVAAVAVQQARGAAVPRRALRADQRDRDAGAVTGHRPLAVLLVVIGAERPASGGGQHRPPPEQGELPGRDVAVVHGLGRGQGFVPQPEPVRLVLRVRPRRHRVDRLGKRNLAGRAVAVDGQAGQPVAAVPHHHVPGEGVHARAAGCPRGGRSAAPSPAGGRSGRRPARSSPPGRCAG